MSQQFNYMDVLKLLADDTRMAILQSLRSGEQTVSAIEEITGKSHSTTSQQLKNMLNANLVTFRKDGTQKFYQIRDYQIFDMLEAISSYLSTSNVLSPAKKISGKRILLMGLDKSGKTSILLSFLGEKNLMRYMNQNLKPTVNKKHMAEILNDLNISRKNQSPSRQSDTIYFEYGGQVVYRNEFKQSPQKILVGFDKIIYVIDIQDTKRYGEALEYLQEIIQNLLSITPPMEIDIFLHKFDPDLDVENEYSQEVINQEIIAPIQQMIPVGFKYTIYRTTIYTVFRKSLMMQTYQAM